MGRVRGPPEYVVSVCVYCGQQVVRQSVSRQPPPYCHGLSGQLSAASHVRCAPQRERCVSASVALDGLCSAYVLRTVLHCAGRRALAPSGVDGRVRPKKERWGHAFPIPTVSAETVTEEVAFESVLECFRVGEKATEYC